MVLVHELGFSMLPCSPDTSPEYDRTTADRVVYAALADRPEHDHRIRVGLARGLLLRSGLVHTRREVDSLARRFERWSRTAEVSS